MLIICPLKLHLCPHHGWVVTEKYRVEEPPMLELLSSLGCLQPIYEAHKNKFIIKPMLLDCSVCYVKGKLSVKRTVLLKKKRVRYLKIER